MSVEKCHTVRSAGIEFDQDRESALRLKTSSIDENREFQSLAVASADNPAVVAAVGLLKAMAMDFQNVYQEFQPRIHRFLCRLVGPEEADDLTQDVFLKVSQALPTFRGESTLSTWVYRIATNSALDKLRSSARVSEVSLDGENLVATDRSPDADQRVFR